MNPFDLLLSWQAILHIALVIALTQGFKALFDYKLGKNETVEFLGFRATRATGADMRRAHPIAGQVFMTAVPLLLGILLALVLPARPQVLETFVALRYVPKLVSYAAWGAIIGAAAEYLFDRFHEFRRASRTRMG